jgi:release factor glutamine methyltransferase
VTATIVDPGYRVVAANGVYAPQDDSRLLIGTLARSGVVVGRRTVDLCTGSGVVAIAAARLGACSVSAWDICSRAIQCARDNAAAAAVSIETHLGSLNQAFSKGPYDLVVSNPPYVPTPSSATDEHIPAAAGPAWAWNAGPDGRLILDQLCTAAPNLLTDGGTMIVVQSEFAGIEESVSALRSAGLSADVVAQQRIPFGPVLTARARWLESTGRLRLGCRQETLMVIRADKR